MSFVIASEDLTLAEKRAYRSQAKEMAITEALNLRIATDRKGLIARNIFPATDLGTPAGSGYSNEIFLTGALVANTWTSVFDTAGVAQLGDRKVIVFYKIVNMTAAPSIKQVEFRLGLTGTSTLARFHLEQIIDVELTAQAYMSEPVVYTRDQWIDIRCIATPAVPAAGERLGFCGYVIEPIGETVS